MEILPGPAARLLISFSVSKFLCGMSVAQAKTTCPHASKAFRLLPSACAGMDFSVPCEQCDTRFLGFSELLKKPLLRSANWFCLACHTVFCGRNANGHMKSHAESTPNHTIAVSYDDLSFWCYSCDSYLHVRSDLSP